MIESSRLLTSVFSHFGHALKNIETVLRGATEELIDSDNENLHTIGNDANIALAKLSDISNLLGLLEAGKGEKIDSHILALENLLVNSCPLEETSTILEIAGVDANNVTLNLPCGEEHVYSLLSPEAHNLNIPMANLLLIKLLYALIREAHFNFSINGKKLC